ncbi:ABC transporter ATP-binding protein [Clostridium sp. YIM B02515]|uniref:ABC transporter ATP-binding protein n=1 Tax=Clostridium rhizosphaerae TaxID=2803861 RepID=A0ABS1TAA9_9CLOT|nr:energy-coupling factor transporter ATPase [Clostridium rhizosphaerae]MBL4935269.1 ABC transporter ATP-binding protein [Clostridium rhizosphaerae]
MKYISIKDLNYKYPDSDSWTLQNVSLDIEKGDMILVLGDSGSGKSTLAKCITGAVPNFYGGTLGGNIFIKEINIKDMEHVSRAKEITMLFQDPERQLVMDKVHREIAFGLENIGIEENQFKRRIWEVLEFLNIEDLAYRDISTLSGGQKQKVAIASAVAYMPGCIILDEPTSQLDPSAAEEVINIVKKINEELGITVIIIEQKIGKWFDYADQIVVLREGKVVHSGDKKSIYKSNEEYVAEFLPTYLKLFKAFKVETYPSNLKEGRKLLEDYHRVNVKSSERILSEDNLIEIKNLECRYGKFQALREFNLNIKKENFLGVIGSNGAGKSTLLKAIMGLVDYSGSIKVFDREVKKYKLKELARTIGYVAQNPNDYISRDTVYEELKFTLDNYKIDDDRLIEETLKNLDILHLKDKNPRDTSGGERQRIAIASILVLKPKILLLDEPTRGLHGRARLKLGETLKKLNEEGTTIIMITHDIEFAAQFCNKFLLIFDGKKAAEGSKEEVLSNGIYYTTVINKLLRDADEHIFTLEQALQGEIKR